MSPAKKTALTSHSVSLYVHICVENNQAAERLSSPIVAYGVDVTSFLSMQKKARHMVLAIRATAAQGTRQRKVSRVRKGKKIFRRLIRLLPHSIAERDVEEFAYKLCDEPSD